VSRPALFEAMGDAIVGALAQNVTATIAGETSVFPAIFRTFRDTDALMGEMHGVEDVRYVFSARAADLAAAAQDKLITVNGVTYRIANVRDDGRAMRKLLLKDA
jgi:hypothetical protein